jgi:WD repeat-containing protein 35
MVFDVSILIISNRAFGTTSRAFIKLESLDELTGQQREEYQELAIEIFVRQAPKDSRSNRSECASCETMIPDW